jgi:dynein heavy chain
MIWSMGVTADEDGRIKFDAYIREQIQNKAIAPELRIPSDGVVYDYMFDLEKTQWIKWINIITDTAFAHDAGYTEIIVKTPDSERNSFLIKRLVMSSKHVIISGPTGTGKTKNILDLFSKALPENKYYSLVINFSAQTSNYF